MFFLQKPIFKKILILLTITSFVWVVLTSPPINFRKDSAIRIERGESIRAIAKDLKKANIIQSEIFFINAVILFNLESKIVAGEYLFKKPSNIFEVISRLRQGDYNIAVKRVTIVEGATVADMAALFKKEFYNISKEEFIEMALEYEGYLFPETYFFPESVNSDEIISKMRLTFDEKIAENADILNSEKSLKDIIVMASIIEKEASKTSMQEVSDILWHRIDINMPLQVDAAFVYERNKHTFQLSLDDLKTDSPYNTYTRYGLTPTPISNPGLNAIRAAAFPKPTKNLYFLTGYDGEMYYAQTLKQHAINRAKYLIKPEE
jgi:UPF0755 protein